MTVMKKEKVCEDLSREQPDLLSAILVKSQFGSLFEDVGILLDIFLVIMNSLEIADVTIPPVSHKEFEKMLRKFFNLMKSSEGMNEEQLDNSIDQFLNSFKEKTILAYVFNTSIEAGFHKKTGEELKLYFAGISIAGCIAKALESR